MARIIEFKTQKEAAKVANKILIKMIKEAEKEGYFFSRGAIYPKNAKTGMIDTTKTPTRIWFEPLESPDGTWYIPDNGDISYKNLGVVGVTALYLKRKERPKHWRPQDIG